MVPFPSSQIAEAPEKEKPQGHEVWEFIRFKPKYGSTMKSDSLPLPCALREACCLQSSASIVPTFMAVKTPSPLERHPTRPALG